MMEIELLKENHLIGKSEESRKLSEDNCAVPEERYNAK